MASLIQGSWRSRAGVVADTEEVELLGRTREVMTRAGAAGKGLGMFREWNGQDSEAHWLRRERKGLGACRVGGL